MIGRGQGVGDAGRMKGQGQVSVRTHAPSQPNSRSRAALPRAKTKTAGVSYDGYITGQTAAAYNLWLSAWSKRIFFPDSAQPPGKCGIEEGTGASRNQ